MPTDTANNAPQLQTVSREDFWQRHVAQWQTSGLSKMAYCQQHALIYHQMMYWSNKEAHVVKSEHSNGFVAVAVSADVRDSVLCVRLPNGIAIEGINDHSIALVGKLVEQL